MKCYLDRTTKLTSKNRRLLEIIDIDTGKKQMWFVCSACFDKVQAMKAQQDGQKTEFPAGEIQHVKNN